jgi:hypothetical protein
MIGPAPTTGPASGRRRWVRTAVVVGAGYFVIGTIFATLAKSAVADPGRVAWRLTAWLVCAALYAAHIAFEHWRLGSGARSMAMHAALAVAVGGFALAVAGLVHSLQVGAHREASWLLALVLWPLVTAVPAFLVALVAGAVLARFRRSPQPQR